MLAADLDTSYMLICQYPKLSDIEIVDIIQHSSLVLVPKMNTFGN